MKQAIVILLKKNKKVEEIRKRYDPTNNRFKPHITLVYPFKDINQEELYEHLENSIKSIKPFKITLKGLKISAKDYYLYLLVDKGASNIIKLYKNMNNGLLKNFKNKALPLYIPHLSLGVFKSKKEINDAINKIKKRKLKAEYLINEINLLNLKKDLTIKSVKKFRLK